MDRITDCEKTLKFISKQYNTTDNAKLYLIIFKDI